MQKGPYFNPVQYISPLPEGYLRASENIANTMGKAMQGFGENIGAAIEKYTKNKEENEFLTGQAEAIVPSLQAYANDIKDDKQKEQYEKLIVNLGNFSNQSLSQKRATLASAGTRLKSFQDSRQAKISAMELAAREQALITQQTYTNSLGLPTTRDEQRLVPTSNLQDLSQYVNAPNQQQIQPDLKNFNLGLYGEKERQGTAMPLGLGSAQGDIYSQSQSAQQQQQAQPGFMNSLAAMQANAPQSSAPPIDQPQTTINGKPKAAQINPAAFAQQFNGSSLNAQTTMFGNPTYRDVNSYSNKPNNALSSFNEKMTYGIIDNFMDASAAVKGIAKMTGIPNAVLKTAGVVDRLSGVNYSPDNPTRRDDILAAFNGSPETPTKTQVAPQTKVTAQAPSFASVQLAKPTAFEASAGMIARGTVNLFEQPIIQNKDGTISTVDSVGVNIKGKEYLLPTVTPDGRHFEGTLKQKAALATEEFNKTGQHLGIFKSVAASNNYAAQLHNDYAAGRYNKPSQGSEFDQSFKQNIDRVDQTSKRTVTDKVALTPNEKYTNQIASIISGGGQITPELNAQLKKDAGVYADADIKTEQIKDAQGRVVATAVISRGTLSNLVLAEKLQGPQSDIGKKITDMNSLLAQGNFAGAQLIANDLKQGSSKMTEGQGKAMQYAAELFETNKTIARLEAAGFNPTNNTWDRFAPNFFKSDEGQQYYSAMDKWIEATLRDRSGAAIQPSEYGNARSQYFPSYGDGAANIAIKKELRNVAMQAMADRAEGKMNNRYFGSTGETSERRKLPNGQVVIIEHFNN